MFVTEPYRSIISRIIAFKDFVIDKITRLFFQIFCCPEEAISSPPPLLGRQIKLIQQKSGIQNAILKNGFNNTGGTTHHVSKVGDCYVKFEKEDPDHQKPVALIEKLMWNIAQILGDDNSFAPTNTVNISPEIGDQSATVIEIKNGILNRSCYVDKRNYLASYQIDSGVVYDNNENLLSPDGFRNAFVVGLIYGVYDGHKNNLLVNEGKGLFFDNPRMLPPTNHFIKNIYGFMPSFRLSLMQDPKAAVPLSSQHKHDILTKIRHTKSLLPKLRNYLSDKNIQDQFDAIPLSWFDSEKSLEALDQRLEIMEKRLVEKETLSLNDLVFAIFPNYKTYAAIVFQELAKSKPGTDFKKAVTYLGYYSVLDLIRAKNSINIASIDPNDSLDDIFNNSKTGPFVEYTKDSLIADFIEKAAINMIEHDRPETINHHISRRFDADFPFSFNGMYVVNGVKYFIDYYTFPDEYAIKVGSALLPPMSFAEFKNWVKTNELPKRVRDAEIDLKSFNAVRLLTQSDMKLQISMMQLNQTLIVQRRYGRSFVYKMIHKDGFGNVKIKTIKDASDIKIDNSPLLFAPDIKLDEVDEILISDVPGYYCARLGDVHLPPMTENELRAWLKSDKKELYRLQMYINNGAVVETNTGIELICQKMVENESKLIQVHDTSPVQHRLLKREGNQIFNFEVIERKSDVGYFREGTWVSLFSIS